VVRDRDTGIFWYAETTDVTGRRVMGCNGRGAQRRGGGKRVDEEKERMGEVEEEQQRYQIQLPG